MEDDENQHLVILMVAFGVLLRKKLGGKLLLPYYRITENWVTDDGCQAS